MLNYNRHYLDWWLQEHKKMVKKKITPKWDWKKFIEGAKRPAIALIVAAFVAGGFDSTMAGILAALIVERGIASATWLINKK